MMKRLNLKEKFTQIHLLLGSLSRGKKTGGAFLILLVGILLYESLITTQALKLKALAFQFHSEKKLVDYYHNLTQNASAITQGLKTGQQDLAKIEDKFVKERGLSEYSANFRKIIASYKLQVLSLDFKPQEPLRAQEKEPLKFYQKLPFDFSVKGSYFNIMLLLQKLEQGSPICEIRELHITQDNPDSYDTVASIKAAVFVLSKGHK